MQLTHIMCEVTDTNNILAMQVDSRYIKKWTIFCAFGELSGIAIAGFIAFFVNHCVGEPGSLTEKLMVLSSMLMAGALEGGLLGWFQWKVLKEKIPLKQKEWIKVTILVALLGWFLGMLPSLFFIPQSDFANQDMAPEFHNHPVAFAVLCVTMGLILGAVFGLFQFVVLRKYVSNAGWWIVANSIGWGVGLGWIYLGASLPDEQSSLLSNVILGALGGIFAGLSVGFVTGLFLRKLKLK